MDEIRAAIDASMAELPVVIPPLPLSAEEEERVAADFSELCCDPEVDCCGNCCDFDCDCF